MKKHYSTDDALLALKKYCAYQDRCHSEVRSKLLSLKIYGDDLEEIISKLIQEKYLDEERFARSYVRGKFKFKKWGRHKIIQNLKQKQVSPYCIKKGLEEIEDEQYGENLMYWIQKKERDYSSDKHAHRKTKVIKFLISKGFEYDYILDHYKSAPPP